MNAEDSLKYISLHKLIPVIRLEKKYNSKSVADTLIEGGIKIIEVSFLSYKPLELIEYLSVHNVFVGAGTIMNIASAREAVYRGASFIVSPHTSYDIVNEAHKHNILAISGCITPTEIVAASQLGVKLIKIFPASSLGGAVHLKSLIDIFPNTFFMPTGGINLDNISQYLELGVFALGLSSSIMPKSILSLKEPYIHLRNLARAYVSKTSTNAPS